MDDFGVPKKLNRHILKALYYMQDIGIERPDLSDIYHLVRHSMRNNVPVRDLPGAVRHSLRNMAQLGVIDTDGCNFFVRHSSVNNRLGGIFHSTSEQHHGGSTLDPNLRKRVASEDSVTGDEREKSRKRFRTSKRLSRKGGNVLLPGARMAQEFDMNFDDENYDEKNENDENDENEENDENYEENYENDENYENSEKGDQSEVAPRTHITEMDNIFVHSAVLKQQLVPRINIRNIHESVSPVEQSNDGAKASDDDKQYPLSMMTYAGPENEEVVTAKQIVENTKEDESSNEAAGEKEAQPTTEVTNEEQSESTTAVAGKEDAQSATEDEYGEDLYVP